MGMLRIGQTVHLRFSGLPCVIQEFVGEGGQGEVYRAHLPSGTDIAVKWFSMPYVKKRDPRIEQRLTELIDLEMDFEEFIWPFDLSDAPGVPAFGYAMPWCKENFKPVLKLINEKPQPTFRALAMAGFRLANAFNHLHSDSKIGGRCYRDISDSNVRVDPVTSHIRILDNDNVDITGTPGPMAGTVSYQAPEIVLKQSFANVYTDLHSLAVILFRLLLVDHPLQGENENRIMGDLVELYGRNPVFVFDPNNASNRPIPKIHTTALLFWSIFPKFIKDLFEQAFTAGLRNPGKRVVEVQWREALVRFCDSIFECDCEDGTENFYDLGAIRSSSGLGTCWNCKKPLAPPPRMVFDENYENVVTLTPKTQLFPHHILKTMYDFSLPLAQVVGKAEGLENLSKQKWVVKTADGSTQEVHPGQVAPLDPHMRIHFGRVTAKVRK
jgi:serine/threonine protein kinase